MTASQILERDRVTIPGMHVEEHRYATDAEAVVYWAEKLYQAQGEFMRGGSIFGLLGPIGVLQRFGVCQAHIDHVIRTSTRHLPFPAEIFQGQSSSEETN